MFQLTRKTADSKGFSLIELMVVLAVIGILSAVAMPAYFNHTMRSKQSKAIGELMMIKAASERYFVEEGTYTTTIGLLQGYSSAGTAPGAIYNNSPYQYWITNAGTVRARGDLNGDGIYCDGWEVGLTEIMDKPQSFSVGCPEGFSLSFLDIF